MSNIAEVIARVYVDDLDEALPLYCDIAGVKTVDRFRFRDLDVASVGPFLLLSGNTKPYHNRVATIIVNDLPHVITILKRWSAEILEGPINAPKGARLIARHPDGCVFEYIEHRPADQSGVS